MKTLKKQSLQLLEKLKSSDVSTTMAQMDEETSNFSNSIMKPSPDCPDTGEWIECRAHCEKVNDTITTTWYGDVDSSYIQLTSTTNDPYIKFKPKYSVDEVRLTYDASNISRTAGATINLTGNNTWRWYMYSGGITHINIVGALSTNALLENNGDYIDFTYWCHVYPDPDV